MRLSSEFNLGVTEQMAAEVQDIASQTEAEPSDTES